MTSKTSAEIGAFVVFVVAGIGLAVHSILRAYELLEIHKLRAGCQGLMFKAMTGEEPITRAGWSITTTLEQYEELNLVGRVAIRLAPAMFAGAIGWFLWVLPLAAPRGFIVLPAAYLLGGLIFLGYFDLATGFIEAAGWLETIDELEELAEGGRA